MYLNSFNTYYIPKVFKKKNFCNILHCQTRLRDRGLGFKDLQGVENKLGGMELHLAALEKFQGALGVIFDHVKNEMKELKGDVKGFDVHFDTIEALISKTK